MGGQVIIGRVQDAVAEDAWWFSDGEVPSKAPFLTMRTEQSRCVPPMALGALVTLVILSDALFWDVDPGISVALFALALSACMVALRPGGATGREAKLAMAFALACNLPMIEQAQPLSFAFTLAGLAALLAWVALGQVTKIWQAALLLGQATFIGPLALPFDAAKDLRDARPHMRGGDIARATALPLGIGALFVLLFTYANPLVSGALEDLLPVELFTSDRIARVFFWGMAACIVWPYLSTQGRWRLKTSGASPLGAISLPGAALINAGSVRTSLIAFNVMFALQTISDAGILSGGMALPEGMTYATYAHRGAYPLVVTALLSGAFAIATHRMVVADRVMRILMYIWLAQNLFLVLTAAFRLGLYVDAYSLTYLRVAAFIWMALVFACLAMIVEQMMREKPLSWLIRWNLIAVIGTLYVCCFVNFAYLITDYNMTNTSPEALDLAYLCNLGEQVIPAMMDYGQATDQTACGRGALPTLRFDPIQDWQEWGFRRWRLQRYLETYHDL